MKRASLGGRTGTVDAVVGAAALGCAMTTARDGLLQAVVGRTTGGRVYTEAQAKRGKDLYVAKCTQCHGETLRGIEYAPPLTGDAFMDVWMNRPLAELVDKTQETMPQNAPGTLDRKQATDIVAYILQVNEFPAGDADLSDNADVLKAITIGK